MTEPPDPDPYFQAIEETFNRRRGAPLLLSPRDWALIDGFRRDGVPLRLVLLGIENVFDAFARRKPGARRINSLAYCRQEILGLHEIHLGLQGVAAGSPGETSAPDPARALRRYLARLAKELREALAAASAAGRDALVGPIAEALAVVRREHAVLKKSPADAAGIERTLAALDGRLLEAAVAALPPAERAAIDEEADRTLGEAATRMRPEARATTRAAARARLVRRHAGLPRLTLFA
ncbi:MAG TPA: hypothetical protein VMQ62_12225 [Dongiaceae bacterium]|nr:hypothetical protein [Dongiaceae bacterium]